MKDPPCEVPHFNRSERLYVEIGIERAKAAQEVQIPIPLQSRMQPAHHVYFGYSKGECFRDCIDDLVTCIFKGMGIALLSGKGAELAGEHTNVGIVDVTVVDVTGVVSIFSLAHDAGYDPERVEIVRAIEIESIDL